MPETEKVPIGRLFTNLSLRLIKNTNDFELTYQLARLHSMAYATNLGEVSALKGSGYPDRRQTRFSGLPDLVQTSPSPEARRVGLEHLTNAIALYERALLLLKRSTNASAWEVVRTQLGLAWCLDQSGQRGTALMAYRKALNTAWRMEVTGNGPFVGDSYCEEIIVYMLKLLDPEHDAKEIADLRGRQEEAIKSLSFRRAYTPILVPLEAGASFRGLVDLAAGVSFDLDGSGILHKWGWITPKAAWLVYDADGCGQITSGLQMFGNVTFWVF